MIVPTERRIDRWVLFDAPLAPADSMKQQGVERDAVLLAWSAKLPGGVKFARPAGGDTVHLRAEIPIPELEFADHEFDAVEAGFIAAACRLGIDVGARDDSHGCGSEVDPLDLARLCAEAGWPFEERAEGGLRIDLAVPGVYCPAHIDTLEGGVFLRAELTEIPESPRKCHEALASLLMGINATHRMVRAVFGNEPNESDKPYAWLEAWLPHDATAWQLAEAIASAAVTARHCALEARCFADDERLARAFLARSREGNGRST